MRFSTATFLASLAAIASANSIEFASQDSTARTIIFTQQEGLPAIPPLQLAGLSNATVEFPTGWIGNFFSVDEGAAIVPGVLGELRWDGWDGLNFFDISAIVNPNDLSGVKTLFPKNSGTPLSGCESFASKCDSAYYQPNDIQTQSTLEKDLVCTVGNKVAKRNARRHPRHFVTGHMSH